MKKMERFWDIRKGFWRIGHCYKEDKKFLYFKDTLNHRYKLSKKAENLTAPLEQEVNKNADVG